MHWAIWDLKNNFDNDETNACSQKWAKMRNFCFTLYSACFVLHYIVLSEIWKMSLMIKHDDTSTFKARLKVVFYTLQIYKKSWKCIFHCHCYLSSSFEQSSKQYQHKVRNYRNVSNPSRDVISRLTKLRHKS